MIFLYIAYLTTGIFVGVLLSAVAGVCIVYRVLREDTFHLIRKPPIERIPSNEWLNRVVVKFWPIMKKSNLIRARIKYKLLQKMKLKNDLVQNIDINTIEIGNYPTIGDVAESEVGDIQMRVDYEGFTVSLIVTLSWGIKLPVRVKININSDIYVKIPENSLFFQVSLKEEPHITVDSVDAELFSLVNTFLSRKIKLIIKEMIVYPKWREFELPLVNIKQLDEEIIEIYKNLENNQNFEIFDTSISVTADNLHDISFQLEHYFEHLLSFNYDLIKTRNNINLYRHANYIKGVVNIHANHAIVKRVLKNPEHFSHVEDCLVDREDLLLSEHGNLRKFKFKLKTLLEYELLEVVTDKTIIYRSVNSAGGGSGGDICDIYAYQINEQEDENSTEVVILTSFQNRLDVNLNKCIKIKLFIEELLEYSTSLGNDPPQRSSSIAMITWRRRNSDTSTLRRDTEETLSRQNSQGIIATSRQSAANVLRRSFMKNK